MIGEHVRWRHVNPDGTRVRDVDGEVKACQLGADNKYRLLVACGTRLETAEAGDLEICTLGTGPVEMPVPPPPTHVPVAPAGRPRRSLLAKDEPK